MLKLKSLLVLTLIIGLFSCEEDEPKITSIELRNSIENITIGDSTLLDIDFTPSNLSAPVTWTSSNNEIAVINENGMLTSINVGNCTITASVYDGAIITSSQLSVTPINADNISLNKDSVSLTIGDIDTLTYFILPENTTYKDVTWSSTNPDVVSVVDGYLECKGVGSAEVIVSIKDSNTSDKCIVNVEPIYTESIILNSSSITLKVGEETNCSYDILPTDATYQDVTWLSLDESIASVSQDGTISAIGVGKTDIIVSVTNTDKSDTCTVTVNPINLSGIQLNLSDIDIIKGKNSTLSITFTPNNATDKTVIWSSDDESIATVTSNGIVNGISEGTTTINVTSNDGGFKASCNVTILPIPVSDVYLSSSSYQMLANKTFQLTANILPSNAANKTVTWSSSNENIATVDANGLVTSVANGNTTISATTEDGDFQASCSVSVVAITESIALRIGSSSIVSINGYISGSMYSYITNNSSETITLTKFEVIDSNTYAVKVRSTDPSQLGDLNSGASTNLGANLNSVYKPIFKWYFTYDGVEYSVQHQDD